ncbi:maleylpyruvate isomerase N-terminal domain-containing protein [Rarobacter incanus]|uniref:Uncharacterized protein (TIGR03083 family) n=1 Tax=Rarobacter incanus TaxID=153494 RepID=A0A542SP88_9MICO|nr:maleylpyruvate isomerase N-terminal domain-containing protein [Rarobacter incanus]TQK76375.1 uncharacterized protein (TIGR03083 family) [Rarobacter incanus]
MKTNFDDARTALAAQWERLDAWLSVLDEVPAWQSRPSTLPDWTVGELVAHLGRAFTALTACEPAPAGTIPLPLAEYLGMYPTRAHEISQVTKALAADIAGDPLAAIRAEARAAFTALDALAGAAPSPGELVVQARRAPITLRDMTISRLIEIVVHAIDLQDSLQGVVDSRGDACPLLPAALQIVADELLRIVVMRGGWSVSVRDPRLWVQLATGRRSYDTDALARALEPQFTSDSIPDLGRVLPIL